MSALPFNPAELWRLHQYFFSPALPQDRRPSALSDRQSVPDSDVLGSADDGSCSDSEDGYDEYEDTTLNYEGEVEERGVSTGSEGGRCLTRRRRASEGPNKRFRASERISAYPRLKVHTIRYELI